MCGATAYFVITINDEQETRLKQIKRAAKAVRFEIKLGRNKIQLEDHTSCLKMNPSRGYAFVVLAALMLSLCIDNSLGAPKRNPFKNVAGKATKLQKKAKKYLVKFGYLSDDFSGDTPTAQSLKNFQEFAGLKQTGLLDQPTVAKLEQPRCGMKDPSIKKHVKGRRPRRYTLQGTKWPLEKYPERTLTWKLKNAARGLDFNTVRRVLYYSLDKWSKAANINFREVSGDAKADIYVSFAPGDHGDPYAFDGRGGTLAHAFYPYPGNDLGGDMHFDDDEDFTYKSTSGTDVFWVAVHEAGHSLGLEHSPVLEAVMYPWYKGNTGGEFDLREDDILGIQALYGIRPAPTAAPSTPVLTTKEQTTKPPTQPPTEPPTEPPTQPPTEAPTKPPTEPPTEPPTKPPTQPPTEPPTQPPTEPPTEPPTQPPTEPPTEPPTQPPTEPPTQPPTEPPTEPPTQPPTEPPTEPPTQPPTHPPTEATTQPPTQPPTVQTKPPGMKDCMAKVDATTIDHSKGWMYVFYGKNFYLVSRRGLRYGPIAYNAYFREIEGEVTAAYSRLNDHNLVLFSGNKYYIYDTNFYLRKGPSPVTDFGLPADAKVDAAIQWTGNSRTRWEHGTKTYIFSGTQYYRYNELTGKKDPYYPREISTAWRGLPSRVTGAVTGFNIDGKPGLTYFSAGDNFYIFDDELIKTETGYPKHIKNWFQCWSETEEPLSLGALFDPRREAEVP